MSPAKYKLYVLIVGSLFFYGYWNWSYVALPVVLTLLTYSATIIVLQSNEKVKQRNLLISIFLILLTLIYFKYFDFLFNTALINVSLPLGISFITFTLISYIVDVTKNRYPIEKSFSFLLGYILFFPQLIAGPILRPRELIPQLRNLPIVTNKMRFTAFVIFTVGLGKKLIFADQIAPYVNTVYENPSTVTFSEWLVGVYGFSMQVYCDFSGYSDMAIGLALFFGIRLPLNFNRPYASASIAEIWRRWHITLSTWFRDYVFFPINGKKANTQKLFFAALFTMGLGGLWHGAGLNFIVWGLLHGFFIAIANFFRGKQVVLNFPQFMKILFVFHFWTLTAICFRATSLENAVDVMMAGINMTTYSLTNLQALVYPLVLLVLFFITHRYDHVTLLEKMALTYKKQYTILGLILIWLIAIVLGASSGGSEKFIYFDF